MGYRLEISKLKYEFCAGKLFGYTNEEKLKSYQWLLKKGYLDGDEYFSYGMEGNIVLNAEEFREFIKLYDDDWYEHYGIKNHFIDDEEMKNLMDNNEQKILQWF